MNRAVFIVFFVFLFFVCITECVWADNVRPAYLGIENSKSGRFEITWKNPFVNGAQLPIQPVFPEKFKKISPLTTIKTSDAVIHKWVFSSDDQSLEGVEIKIKGLESTTSDVLFRIKFTDGKIFRTVLRPNEPFVTIPLSEDKPLGAEKPIYKILRKVDSGRFLLLLFSVGVLGALPSSRKKGVIFCSAALIAGSLSGYFLGQAPIKESLAFTTIPSEEKCSHILQGLLLNVYRSSSYIDEEAAYDQMARSVAGDLLTTVYLQNRDAMKSDEEGQAKSYVERLDIREIDSISAIDGGGFSLIASWDVYGSVNHWEHIHYRCNSYKARLALKPDGTYWKITDFSLLDEKRVM